MAFSMQLLDTPRLFRGNVGAKEQGRANNLFNFDFLVSV